MDSDLLLFILVIEVSLLLFFLLMIIIHRVVYSLQRRIHNKRKKILTQLLLTALEHSERVQPEFFQMRFYWKKDLLETLEVFNLRVQGDQWDQIKGPIVQRYLLPQARTGSKSFFWKTRSRAARIFALFPLPNDESLLLRLMEDRKDLVKRPALLAGLAINSRSAVKKALQTMTNRQGFLRFVLRDALLRGPQNVIFTMIGVGQREDLHEACLDVLSAKSWPFPLPFLAQDVHSSNLRIRTLALATIIRNPIPDCVDILNHSLQDKEEEIRILAAKGLAVYSPAPHFEHLERALSDESWFVRIEAATTLLALGESEILKRQISERALSAIRYIYTQRD